jgi:hypothetical protein
VKKNSFFIQTTGSDHIASPYFVLMNKSKKSGKRIRITMTFRPEQNPWDNFSFSIQDEKFRILYSYPSSKISAQPDNVFHQVIPLMAEFQKLRIIFRTSREMPMPIPISLKVENLVTII